MEFHSLRTNEPLFLAPRYRAILLDLLQRYVPEDTVWAFGSRATGKYLGRFSDLDLAVEKRLPGGVRASLMEALDESDLPIKVDFVELDKVDAAFADRIRPDFVLVRAGRSVDVAANLVAPSPESADATLKVPSSLFGG